MGETRRVMMRLEAVSPGPDDSAEEPIVLTTMGEVRHDGDTTILTYTETGDDPSDENDTEVIMLTIRPEIICMDKIGDFSSSMVFRPGLRYEDAYHTPFGDLPLVITGSTFELIRDPDSGWKCLKLRYGLSIGGSPAVPHRMSFSWGPDPE